MVNEELIYCGNDGIDSLNPQSLRSTNESRFQELYQTIGKTLSNLEASTIKVGIPWLPPTKNVRAHHVEFDSSVDEYIRSELVGVSTHALESYAEDLETKATKPRNSKKERFNLHLYQPTFIERYALTGSVFIFCFILLFASLTVVTKSLSLAILVAPLISVAIGSILRTLSSEPIRLYSFHQLLLKEILRRRGQDGPHSKIRIQTPEPSPS